MRIQTKLTVVLLVGLGVVLGLSQGIQQWRANRQSQALAQDATQLMQNREDQNSANLNRMIDFVVTEAIANGEMEVFAKLTSLQADIPGLQEFTLYDQNGRASHSSNRSALRQPIAETLRTELYVNNRKVERRTPTDLEVYQPRVASQSCLECHPRYQPGAVVGVSYVHISTDVAARLKSEFAASADENRRARTMEAGGTMLGVFMVAVGLVFYSTRSLKRTLTGITARLIAEGDELSSESAQVAQSSKSLADDASQQAASLEESSSALEELSSMTKRNAESAARASTLVRQARATADLGAGDMQAMSAAMGALSGSSSDIAKIVKAIEEIAFQTNILALNAAVEAARAGEAGLGFAVVADEVRALAQRSTAAAHETAAKIQEAISRSAQGAELSEKVASRLREIIAAVHEIDGLIAETATATREQSQGLEQITANIAEMDKVTQRSAASAEESASAAVTLSAHAADLDAAAHALLALVEKSQTGKSASAVAGPAAEETEPTAVLPRPAKPAIHALPVPRTRSDQPEKVRSIN